MGYPLLEMLAFEFETSFESICPRFVLPRDGQAPNPNVANLSQIW